MPSFRRNRRETASAWAARLSRVDPSALTPEQLEELTLRRLLAERALKREKGGRVPIEDAPESEELRRCKECVRALASEDRRRLLEWADNGLRD